MIVGEKARKETYMGTAAKPLEESAFKAAPFTA